MQNPLHRRRVALGLIALAAVMAGGATWLRDRQQPGSGGASATYLLDVLAWVLAVVGAVVDARVGDLLLSAGLMGERRRALLFAIVGLGVGLTACMTIPGRPVGGGASLLRIFGSAVLVGGAGIGLAGLGTLAWFYGGRYASERIERMGDEDW